MKKILFLLLVTMVCFSCTNHPNTPVNYAVQNEQPDIYPDYKDVVVPPNICPLNFGIRGDVEECVARLTYNGNEITYGGVGNKVLIDESEWKEVLNKAKGGDIKVDVFTYENGNWKAWKPFTISVAIEPIDEYIAYRQIFPSYVAYEMLNISQRNLTNFDEVDIYNNMNISGGKDGQCVNCHSFQNYKTKNMQFHMRQGHGGTMIVHNNVAEKVNLKTDSTISAGVYPSWHPTKPLIAYSNNKTGQTFHTRSHAKIEVQDTESDIILYDVEKKEVRLVCSQPNELESFPNWSPDGKYLYYCSAHFEYENDTLLYETEMIIRFDQCKYDIYRKPYDEATGQFGEAELLYKASADSLSATFPKVSPDGRYLLVGVGHFGCFHVWHPEADLWLMDLKTKQIRKLENVNSDFAESYHAWSSNGRWMIFISRRDDSNYSRLYMAYFDKDGKAHKAFELPQRDPDFYTYFMRSYNVPEFITEPVSISPQEFTSVARKDATPVKYVPGGERNPLPAKDIQANKEVVKGQEQQQKKEVN